MFFSHSLLQRRGDLGIIWLAATNKKIVNKREIQKVCISKKCEEILKYLLNRVISDNNHVKRFSLYLSAQLMYGTVTIYFEQIKILLSDCYEAEKRVAKDFKALNNQPHEADSRPAKELILAEMFDSSALFLSDVIPVIRNNVALLEESVESFREDEVNTLLQKNELLHGNYIAHPDSITLTDQSSNSYLAGSSSLFPVLIPPAEDLAPMTVEEFEKMAEQPPHLSPILSGIDTEIPDMMRNMQDINEITPAIIEPPHYLPGGSHTTPAAEDTLEPEMDHAPALKRRRLALPPLDIEERLPRHILKARVNPKLIVDNPTYLSKEEIKKQLNSGAKTTKPPILPSPVMRIEDLMVLPGNRDIFKSMTMKATYMDICQATVTELLPGSQSQTISYEDTMNNTAREGARKQSHGSTSDISLPVPIPNTPIPQEQNKSDHIAPSPARQAINTSSVVLPVTETVDNLILEQVDTEIIPPEPPQDFILPPIEDLAAQIAEPQEPDFSQSQALDQGQNVIHQDVNQQNLTSSAKKQLIGLLKKEFKQREVLVFNELEIMKPPVSRLAASRTFMAALTLVQSKRINVVQEIAYGPITIMERVIS